MEIEGTILYKTYTIGGGGYITLALNRYHDEAIDIAIESDEKLDKIETGDVTLEMNI